MQLILPQFEKQLFIWNAKKNHHAGRGGLQLESEIFNIQGFW